MSRPQQFHKHIHYPAYASFSQVSHTRNADIQKNQKSLIQTRKFTPISTQTVIQSSVEEQVYELKHELQKKNNLLSMMKKKLASECINYNKQMKKLQQVLAMYMQGRKQSKKSFMYEVSAIIEKIQDTGQKIKEEDSDDRNSQQLEKDENPEPITVKKEQSGNKVMKELQLLSLTDNDQIQSRENFDDSHYYNRSAIEVERSQHQIQNSYQDYSTPYEPVSYQIARPSNVSQANDSHYSFKGDHTHKINEQKPENLQNKQVYVKFHTNQYNRELTPGQNIKPEVYKNVSPQSDPKINHVHIKETKRRSDKQKKLSYTAKMNQIQQEQKSISKIENTINFDHSLESNVSSHRNKSPKSQKSSKSLLKTKKSTIISQNPIKLQISRPENINSSNLSISKPIQFIQTPKTLKAPFIEKCKDYEVRKNKYTYSTTKRFQFLELCLNEKDVNFSAIIKIGLFDVSRIQMLSLANNLIADQQFKMLVNFKWLSLTSINLWGNQITDIEPIRKIDLSKLFELSISWNPLNKQSAEFFSEQVFISLFHFEVSFQKTKNDEYLTIMTKSQFKNFPSIGTLKIFESQEISQSSKMKTRFLIERYCKEKAKTKKLGRIPKIKLFWQLSRQEYENRLDRYAASSCTSVVNVQELSPLEQKELSQALSGKIIKSGKKQKLQPGKQKDYKKGIRKTKSIKKVNNLQKEENKKQSKLEKLEKNEAKDKDSLVSDI